MGNNVEEWAKKFDGVQHYVLKKDENKKKIDSFLKSNKLILLSISSDDELCIQGIGEGALDTYEGGKFIIYDDMTISPVEAPSKAKKRLASVTVFWCKKGSDFVWDIETELEHSTFSIMEGNDKFCRAIIIDCSNR